MSAEKISWIQKIARHKAEKILDSADIKIDGNRPFDIEVHDNRFFVDVFLRGSLALGESYMKGWWDSGAVDETITRLLKININSRFRFNPIIFFHILHAIFVNEQSRRRAYYVGERHYDIGNDLYEKMLDKGMVYTCGYWRDARTLDEAQEAKFDLVCRKLNLKKGDHILDIGCGWGSLLKFASERYGVSGVGITISKEQVEYARNNIVKGLPIEIRLQDYRDIQGSFDHVVSLGMFEHVGYKNYQSYMKAVHRVLKKSGLFLLHTIGSNKTNRTGDPWLNKYIFPNGMLPSISQIDRSIQKLFVMEDWHNFGTDYDKTLVQWFENFERAWPDLKSKYNSVMNGQFYRMWKYYLLSMAGAFRSRQNAQLWQIVLSKGGVEGGYQSAR